MPFLRRTIPLALAALLSAAASHAAGPAFLNAVSDHFDLYTTDNEAAARAALDHFETARAYVLRLFGGADQFKNPVRLIGYKSNSEYRSHLPASIEAEHAFSKINGEDVTIVVDGLKPESYQYALREYVNLLILRAAPGMPYWLRMGFRELYCTLKTGDGSVHIGEDPAMERRVDLAEPTTTFLTLLFGLNAGSAWGDSAEAAHAASKFIALGGIDNTMGVGVDHSYRLTALHLTRMMMFDKAYNPKFNAFVNAVKGGADTTATFKSVYGQSLADLIVALRYEMVQASHPALTVKFSLPAAVSPRITHLSAGASDDLISEIKSRK
jgi:hypothetical protein